MTRAGEAQAGGGAPLPVDVSGAGRIARDAVLVLTALLVALMLVGTGATAWRGYLEAIDDASTSTATLATVLDEHAQRTIRLVEVTVEGLASTLNAEIEAGPLDVAHVATLLANRKHIARDLLNLIVIDAGGRSVVDAFGARSRTDLNERSYVRFHRESPREGIFVSEPITSLAGRGRIVVVSHRLFNVDGSFAGIVAATVSTEYFQTFYRSIDVGPLGVVTLRTRAGTIVARQPPGPAGAADERPADSTVAAAVATGQISGTLHFTSQNDEIQRVTSFRTVSGSPYIVSVGRAYSDFLAPWRDDVRRYAIGVSVLAAAAMAACWFLLRQISARDRADEARHAGERAAAEAVRRSAAQEQRARERLETILNRMPIGCIVSDASLRMTYVNPAAERIFGTRFEDVKGLTPLETGFVVADREAVQARHESLRRGEVNDYSVTQTVTKDDRTITCEWTNTALTEPDGSFGGIIAMVQDVTERSNAEETLRQSAKMEAVGQLTGGVAHDFNNLLTIIMANIELTEGVVEDRPEAAASLQAALGAALRGGELTRQLLAFSRRQTLEPKVVRLNELVEGMTRLLSRTIGENVETSLRAAPDVWPVRIDPTQLETALANLVVNARDAMPDGGKLLIETANAPLDEAYAARHPEVTAGDYVALSVSDTGTGMTPEVLARVFEPFFTTKEVGKGTGLGMSMVFGFVKQSGGHIKIYSEAGIGTTIRLYLPRAVEGGGAASDAAAVGAPSPARSGEVILLVEDDANVRESGARNLQRFGYRIVVAADGPEALDILGRGDRVDLLFTDLVMPGGMNGVQLALEARQKRPGLKVLLTSGYAAPTLASQIRQVDGAAFMSKPYRIADLAHEVRRVMDRA